MAKSTKKAGTVAVPYMVELPFLNEPILGLTPKNDLLYTPKPLRHTDKIDPWSLLRNYINSTININSDSFQPFFLQRAAEGKDNGFWKDYIEPIIKKAGSNYETDPKKILQVYNLTKSDKGLLRFDKLDEEGEISGINNKLKKSGIKPITSQEDLDSYRIPYKSIKENLSQEFENIINNSITFFNDLHDSEKNRGFYTEVSGKTTKASDLYQNLPPEQYTEWLNKVNNSLKEKNIDVLQRKQFIRDIDKYYTQDNESVRHGLKPRTSQMVKLTIPKVELPGGKSTDMSVWVDLANLPESVDKSEEGLKRFIINNPRLTRKFFASSPYSLSTSTSSGDDVVLSKFFELSDLLNKKQDIQVTKPTDSELNKIEGTSNPIEILNSEDPTSLKKLRQSPVGKVRSRNSLEYVNRLIKYYQKVLNNKEKSKEIQRQNTYVDDPDDTPILDAKIFDELRNSSKQDVFKDTTASNSFRKYLGNSKGEEFNNLLFSKELFDLLAVRGDREQAKQNRNFLRNIFKLDPKTQELALRYSKPTITDFKNLGLRYEHVVPVAVLAKIGDYIIKNEKDPKLQEQYIDRVLEKLHKVALLTVQEDSEIPSQYTSTMPRDVLNKIGLDKKLSPEELVQNIEDLSEDDIFSRYRSMNGKNTIIPINNFLNSANAKIPLSGYTRNDFALKKGNITESLLTLTNVGLYNDNTNKPKSEILTESTKKGLKYLLP